MKRADVPNRYSERRTDRTILLANVGQRDVRIDVGQDGAPEFRALMGEDASKVADHLRQRGVDVERYVEQEQSIGARGLALAIREHLDQIGVEALRFPILQPALEYALQAGPLDELLLFGTRQRDQRFAVGDTVVSAQLLADSLIPRAFPALGHKVRVIPVEDVNPAAYDETFQFFGSFLRKASKELRRETVARCFASLRGGTPALNAALQAMVLAAYGRRAVLLEVDEPERTRMLAGKSGTARAVDSWPFRKAELLRTVNPLLAHHDYAGVVDLVEAGISQPESARLGDLIALLRHADARFNLDFGRAAHILEYDVSPTLRERQCWLETAVQPWGVQRIADVGYSAKLLLEREDQCGFAVRVGTLCEWVRRHLVWHLLELKLSADRLPERDASKVTLDGGRDLSGALRSKGLRPPPGSPFWWVNNQLLNGLIAIGRRTARGQTLEEAVSLVEEALGRFDRLERLRHDCVHLAQAAPRPITTEEFQQQLEDLLSQLESVERRCGVSTHRCGDLFAATEVMVRERLESL